jgi:hypothetical protein
MENLMTVTAIALDARLPVLATGIMEFAGG